MITNGIGLEMIILIINIDSLGILIGLIDGALLAKWIFFGNRFLFFTEII